MGLTKQQKKLAINLSKGMSDIDAGKQAGYKHASSISKVKKNPVMVNYMNKVLNAVAQREEFDKRDLQGAVSEVIQYECVDKPGIKLRGIELLMKSAGMLSDDKAVNIGVFATMPKLSDLDTSKPTKKLDVDSYVVNNEKDTNADKETN